MSPMGVHSRHALVKVHEEIMDKKKKKQVLRTLLRAAKSVKSMNARQKNLLATATLGFSNFKD